MFQNGSYRPGWEAVPQLGPPFDEFAEAVLRANDARRREHVAQIAGDVNARERAALDREEAAGAAYAINDHEAHRFLFALRATLALYPGALAVHLDGQLPTLDLLRTEHLAQAEAIAGLDARATEIEDAVVALEAGRRAVTHES